jgi:hypothetical protein
MKPRVDSPSNSKGNLSFCCIFTLAVAKLIATENIAPAMKENRSDGNALNNFVKKIRI